MNSGGSYAETTPLPRNLPIELYKHILGYIAPNYDSTTHIDKAVTRRQFLSFESLPPPDPSRSRDSIADICRFRRTCRVFAEIGAEFLVTQVATRFSKKGLSHLEQLARWPHLACHVKRFSYLVPYFFENGLNNLDEIKEELREVGLRPSDLRRLRERAHEQRMIIAGERDVQVLKNAISTFTSLQLIQLLRVAGEEDNMILTYLRNHAEARRNVNLDWTSACSHASQTLGTALMASGNVQWNRFSLPMASPTSARFLRVSGPGSISTLAERLTCLTLHFDDSDDLDTKLQELTELFEAVFTKAKKMKAVHIGFPSYRPLTLPLEDIFHNVTWEDLIAFGVQGWELDAEEIVSLLRRHKNKLRGVRLRDVHLKEGSLWKDVLGFLRDEMRQLSWVSLRRIGYTAYFHSPEFSQHTGAEVPGEMPEDSDSEEADEIVVADPRSDAGSEDEEEGESEENHDVSSESAEESSDEEHGPAADEMEFPSLDSPVTPPSAPWCSCDRQTAANSVDALDDDGYLVDNTKRKLWEQWVLNRCPEHDEG